MKLIQIFTFLLLVVNINLQAQDIPYGVNEKAGHYCNVGDANIYYEVYGEGKPIVLLHGGFGYIDNFKYYIPILSKKYKVICIATRGYGKSEMGSRRYSYDLLAEDVKKIIEKEGKDKAIVMGFSDGAMVSYLVAYKYPEKIDKVVAMGGPLGASTWDKDGQEWLKNFSSEEFESYRPDFKEIVPEPERWNEFIEDLRIMWCTPLILQPEGLKKISCPVLLLFGDHDLGIEHVATIYNNLPNAQLTIFPNSTHIEVSFRYSKNSDIIQQYILKFIENK